MEKDLLIMSEMFYDNVDPRRKQELVDSRMVQEDHAAVSNLSNKAVYRTFNPDEYQERLSMYNQSQRTRR